MAENTVSSRPVRRLPKEPNLAQLRKQAKELLAHYRAGEPAAVAEVHHFERHPDPAEFALHDAQRVLARAYGYESWAKLKAFVDGVNVARLARAVQAGDVTEVQEILDARPELVAIDMNANDEHRAIHYAVLRRDVEMVRLLMQRGADARKGIYPHRDATSAWALARDREFSDIVAVIEEEGARRSAPAGAPRVPGAKDITLAAAVTEGDAARLRTLLTAAQKPVRELVTEHQLLTLAVRRRRIEIAKLLLDLGADVDERMTLRELEEPTLSWGQPLWYAALANDLEMTRLLLDRGADPNANVYASGWPLRNAWSHEDDSVKQLLLARGAKVQPYMVAEFCDAAEAERILAADTSEDLARELLWSACDNGCPAIVRLALPRIQWARSDPQWHWVIIQPIRGAGADVQDNERFLTCMELLLRHGVDPNVARFGQTALHFTAARHGGLNDQDRARFAAMLIDYGARLDFRDDLLRSTPLGWACRWGRLQLVEVLIARGAPVHEPDAEPWATPTAWATKMGHQDVLGVLESHA